MVMDASRIYHLARRHKIEVDRRCLAAELERYKEDLCQCGLVIRVLIQATPGRRAAG